MLLSYPLRPMLLAAWLHTLSPFVVRLGDGQADLTADMPRREERAIAREAGLVVARLQAEDKELRRLALLEALSGDTPVPLIAQMRPGQAPEAAKKRGA